MRLNGRTWPVWVIVAGTVWFVAIAVFWALKPLHDHVPTTVAPTAAQIVVAQQAGQPAPGPQAGPTVEVECRDAGESSSRDLADEQVDPGRPAGRQRRRRSRTAASPACRASTLTARRTSCGTPTWSCTCSSMARDGHGAGTPPAHHRHVPVSAFAAA